jgi:tetratricopeptide (TPR) repeat protein
LNIPPPLNYLVTEFTAIWIYLRLLFLPYVQALDYDLPIVATIWTWKNVVAFFGIAALLTAAAFLRKRLPQVSAGILWFFLGLAVESTIIPLDPVFEHRLYIPMFGFALVVMAAVSRLPRRGGLLAAVLLVGVLSVLTWKRNDLWNDPTAFYEDNLRRAPRSERVHLDLANVYRKQGRLDEAQRLYEHALEINPDYVLIHINLSMVYTAQMQQQKAVDILLEGIRRNPSHFKLYNNLGVLYNSMGQYAEAASVLQKGVMLEPYNATVHFNLGMALERLGRLNEALTHYRRSIELNYGDPASHFNLGLALHRKGNLQEALQEFLVAARLNPNHAGT